MKSRAIIAASLVFLPGCHTGGHFADAGSFVGGGEAMLGLFFGPFVILGFIAKDIAEILSSPLPWDTGPTP